MKTYVKIFSLILLLTFVFACPYFLNGYFFKETKTEKNIVLSLWHVDTFEGGIGSRQDFLMKRAIEFSKQKKGVYISVIKHTEESVKDAFEKGRYPDLISFGIGVDGVFDKAKPLKTQKNNVFFTSSSVGDTTYFYPWAYGKYLIVSLPGSKADNITVSKGKNFALFSAMRAGVEYTEFLKPIEAYSSLVGGKCKLFGTQRDAWRVIRRGLEFNVESVGDFTDLVQYIAVTASDKYRTEISAEFCEYLISDNAQKNLNEIGMFSPTGAEVNYGEQIIQKLSEELPKAVLSPIIDEQKRVELYEKDGQNDFFEKFEEYIRF